MLKHTSTLTIMKVQLGTSQLEFPIDEKSNNLLIIEVKMRNNMLNPDNQVLFNKLLLTCDINEIFIYINVALSHFELYEINIGIYKKIISWVKKFGKCSYVWNELLNKPMYSLELFNNRFWPYIKTKNKSWVKIANDVLVEREYPNLGTTKSDDYDKEIEIASKYNNYLGYEVLNPSEYTDFTNIIYNLSTMLKINMHMFAFECIIKIMVSPDTCDIIKDVRIRPILDEIFAIDKSIYDVFMYYYYYAVFVLNHEDIVMFSKVKKNYRIVFTHEEALNMYSSHTIHIERDPYIQQLSNISLSKSVVAYTRCKRYIQPVNVFRRRLQLATGHALDNILLENYNAAISGSIIIPCSIYTELEDDFKHVRFDTTRQTKINTKYSDDLYKHTHNNEERDFMSYLEYYYPSYHSLKDAEFIKKITKAEQEKLTEMKVDKTIPTKKYNKISDMDISITVDNYDTFEDLAMLLYNAIKKNCEDYGDVYIQKIYTAASFKFKLYGPGLIRPIDLFRISHDPCKMVKKFHCPVVRSWYAGCYSDDIKYTDELMSYWESKININNSVLNTTNNHSGAKFILSCVMTLLSGVNNSYKWFFNSKPCVEVILKYAQRGFSTIINQSETTALINYMETSPRWKNYTNIIGLLSVKNQFYSPCVNNDGIRHDLREFKKPCKIYVNNLLTHTIYNGKTKYDANLTIKTNKNVFKPNYVNIHALYEHIIEQK